MLHFLLFSRISLILIYIKIINLKYVDKSKYCTLRNLCPFKLYEVCKNSNKVILIKTPKTFFYNYIVFKENKKWFSKYSYYITDKYDTSKSSLYSKGSIPIVGDDIDYLINNILYLKTLSVYTYDNIEGSFIFEKILINKCILKDKTLLNYYYNLSKLQQIKDV